MVVNCNTCNLDKNNRYTIQPQELSKMINETLVKAMQTLSLITKDVMNRVNNG